tara:strand:+ start:135 stop:593 length:459 start_codon:yes stop_codon:yes gene_type:complete
MAKKMAAKSSAKKKPSKIRTGSHSAGGEKRYTDVKRKTTATPRGMDSYDVRIRNQILRERRQEAAKKNKRASTPTGWHHSGSAAKSGADSMNAARTETGQRLAADPYSAINRKKRAAAEARKAASESRKAAAHKRRWALEADISKSNPPGFQ